MGNRLYTDFREQLGKEIADRLCEVYGGETIYIPNNRTKQLNERNAAICKARQDGRTVSQLVEQFGLSKRMISNILHNKRHGAN